MADGTAQQCGRVGSCHIYLKMPHICLWGIFILCLPEIAARFTPHAASPKAQKFSVFPLGFNLLPFALLLLNTDLRSINTCQWIATSNSRS
jgi:hypothetical protein